MKARRDPSDLQSLRDTARPQRKWKWPQLHRPPSEVLKGVQETDTQGGTALGKIPVQKGVQGTDTQGGTTLGTIPVQLTRRVEVTDENLKVEVETNRGSGSGHGLFIRESSRNEPTYLLPFPRYPSVL